MNQSTASWTSKCEKKAGAAIPTITRIDLYSQTANDHFFCVFIPPIVRFLRY
jgi:hypothetical protein